MDIASELTRLNSRVAALESFQLFVVHDLNAYLRVIENFSNFLVEDYMDNFDDDGKHYILRIHQSAKKMRLLIIDIMRLSKVTQGDIKLSKESVCLSDIVRTILDEHALIYNEEKRNYKFHITPNVYELVDKELITIALLNLLSNAWKFSKGVPVTEIEFGYTVVDGQNVYYVKDNGVGFDMAKAEKLFKPFSRLHSAKDFDGNGVGLAIVKQIIDLHDGKVWAEGLVNQGATFYFTIGNTYA